MQPLTPRFRCMQSQAHRRQETPASTASSDSRQRSCNVERARRRGCRHAASCHAHHLDARRPGLCRHADAVRAACMCSNMSGRDSRSMRTCWSQAPMMPLCSMAALDARCRLPVLTDVRLPAGSTRTRRTSCWRDGARCRRASTPARSPTSCRTPARCTSCWSRIDAATVSPVRLDSNLSASSCMLLATEEGAQLQLVAVLTSKIAVEHACLEAPRSSARSDA